MKIIFDDGTEQEIDGAQVVNIQPGDVVVFQIKERLTADAYRNLHHDLSKVFRGTPIIILEDGMQLSAILRKGSLDGPS